MSAEAVCRGFDYVIKIYTEGFGNLKDDPLAFQRWLVTETNRAGSDIEDWSHAIIKDAWNALQSRTSLAKYIDDHPLTLAALKPSILLILKLFWPTLNSESIVFLGASGM